MSANPRASRPGCSDREGPVSRRSNRKTNALALRYPGDVRCRLDRPDRRAGCGSLVAGRYARPRRVERVAGHPLRARTDCGVPGPAHPRVPEVDSRRTRTDRPAQRPRGIADFGRRQGAGLAARSGRLLRVSRHGAPGRADARRRFRRSPQRTRRRDVVSIVGRRELEPRLALQGRRRLARLPFQAIDRTAARMGVRHRAARSGSNRQPGQLRRYAAQRAGRFPPRLGTVREEVGPLEGRQRVRTTRRVCRPSSRSRDLAGVAKGLRTSTGRGVCDVRIAPLHRLSRAARPKRRGQLRRDRTPPVQRQPGRQRFSDRSIGLSLGRRLDHTRVFALLERQIPAAGGSDDAELSSSDANRSALGVRGDESVPGRPVVVSYRNSRAEKISGVSRDALCRHGHRIGA